jgi:hypothetical protein
MMPGSVINRVKGETPMIKRETIFHSGNPERIWEKFCGFLDLSLSEFMDIQKGLLMEQIDLVWDSPLGKVIMNKKKPKNLEEFRSFIPLTTYDDYAGYIGECQEDALAIKPELWAHTSGRGGQFKWIPYSMQALEKLGDAALSELILAATDYKGEVNIREGSYFLSVLAPRPYISGVTSLAFSERFGLKLLPPQDVAEKLDYRRRIEVGFEMALRHDVDVIGALGTVLVQMGQRITEQSQGMKFSWSLLHPVVLSRLIRAWFSSKIQRRAMLPCDLWPAKGLACGGTDASIYKKTLEYYWGKTPHEIYGATEALGVLAMQSWAKKGVTFYPFLNFLEFIPEEERLKSQKDKDYQPATVLLDEVKTGEIYELVITNFYGLPFLRYRLSDLIKVISLEEVETGIKLPQFIFHARADDLIDLYSIVRLDENTLWQAITDTQIGYSDWSARKEYENNWPILRLYIELKEEVESEIVATRLNECLQTLSAFYKEAVEEAQTNPVRVTPLPAGSFSRYYEMKQKAGADLAHLKPSHMNAPDSAIQDLLRVSKQI